MPKSRVKKADPLTPVFSATEDTGIDAGPIVPRLRNTQKIGPARAYLDSLGIGAKSMAEVARMLGVSVRTMRELLEVEELSAPSYVADWGQRTIYVYTPEDVAELRAHLAKQRSVEGLRKRKP